MYGMASIRSRIGGNTEERYLFKAKRTDNGEWVQGYYVKGLDLFKDFEETHLIFEPNTVFYSSGETDGWRKVDPTTICQCTGLKYKNGKWVWENDIVKYDWGGTRIDFIEYQPPIFTYSKSMRWNLQQDEVIGNIFDNPELLESEA